MAEENSVVDTELEYLEATWLAFVGHGTGSSVEINADAPSDAQVDAGVTARPELV